MAWLSKILSTINSDRAEQATEQVAALMSAGQSLTAEPEVVDGSGGKKNDQRMTQRRYFVKSGLYVDNEEEILAAQSAVVEREIVDKAPVDLKSLFPKLSLR